MAKFYIQSGSVSFVVCANDAEGAAPVSYTHLTLPTKA